MPSERTRTITLHQPWASLIALGVKRIETRSWPAPEAAIGQRLLIHAAARMPGPGLRLGPGGPVVMEEWLVTAPGSGPYGDGRTPMLLDLPNQEAHPLPLGAIVGSCTLAASVPMVGTGESKIPQHHLHVADHDRTLWLNDADAPSVLNVTDQRPYGDFAPGRFAWLLEDVKPTTERCPACLGTGNAPDRNYGRSCRVCDGEQRCDPIPAKGSQRIWWWTHA